MKIKSYAGDVEERSMGKNLDFNKSEEEFRLRVAEAIGDGVDPLDYLGRDW